MAESCTSCPRNRKTGPENQKKGSVRRAKRVEIQIPMRVARRTWMASPLEVAAATSGITALAKPEPSRKITTKKVLASATAASSLTPYQPIITVSVRPIEICARWLPTSGSDSAQVSRR